MEINLSETNSLLPDTILSNTQEETSSSPDSMPILVETLDGSSPFSQPEAVDDRALVSMSEIENGCKTQGESSSFPPLIPVLAETLDGSSSCSQTEDVYEFDLAPVLENENGSSPSSPLETLGGQFSDPSLPNPTGSSPCLDSESPAFEADPTSLSSPLNANNLLNWESNSHSESSGPSQWSSSASSWSRWPSSSSSKQSPPSSELFPIEESKPNLVVCQFAPNLYEHLHYKSFIIYFSCALPCMAAFLSFFALCLFLFLSNELSVLGLSFGIDLFCRVQGFIISAIHALSMQFCNALPILFPSWRVFVLPIIPCLLIVRPSFVVQFLFA